MLLRSGHNTTTHCCIPRRARTKRSHHLPYLPFDVQRQIFRAVPDIELFLTGDLPLQHYLIEHDMLSEPQLCLAWAARQGHSTLVHLMLRAGIEPSPQAVEMAAKGGHVFRDLSVAKGVLAEYHLRRGDFCQAVCFFDPAHTIPERTFEETLRKRLYGGGTPFREDEARALWQMWPDANHAFVYWGAIGGLQWLLRMGLANGGNGSRWGGVVWHALEENHVDCAEMLMQSGTVELTFSSYKAFECFNTMCGRGHLEALQFALRHTQPPQNLLDTALESAAEAGCTGTVNVLLQHGANSGARERAAIYAAASRGHVETYHVLVAVVREP